MSDVPSQHEVQAGAEVVQAGAAAAAAEPAEQKRPAARRAIKREAAAKGWELSDDDADKLAGLVVDKLGGADHIAESVVGKIRDAGGFDAPLEQVSPPPAAPGPPAAAETAPEAPVRRSFAERFRGNG